LVRLQPKSVFVIQQKPCSASTENPVRLRRNTHVKRQKASDQWELEALSEIRIGATEAGDGESGYLSVTKFTTAAGRQFSIPFAATNKFSRGKRIYSAPRPQNGARES
ncbi:hypothetical protein P0D96_47340, partial [Paraburkholderia sp. RL17-347-BIC-D]